MARRTGRIGYNPRQGETQASKARNRRAKELRRCLIEGAQVNQQHAQTVPRSNPLDTKILGILGDRVILKPLTRWNEAYKEFPRYVMEYLVSRYVDPADPVAGQRKIDKILSEHYTESAKKELIKSRIKEN